MQLYREHHLIEGYINKITHLRRVFSRFNNPAGRYMGFLQFAPVLNWLR